MKTKKVTQFKCDYCGKKGYSGGHMKRHEEHCTKNPNRKCRMCELVGIENKLSELIAMFPDPIYGTYEYNDGINDINVFELKNGNEINSIINNIRGNETYCPACTLAALRQKQINVCATGFNYKKEIDDFWSDYNESRCTEENYY